MKNILITIAALLATGAAAQTVTFDTPDYKGLGVYDTWEESPFRDGRLQGHVAVIDNPFLADSIDLTPRLLAVQRSRFGSNTFGARIDLTETFELTPTTRYVHVMLRKPTTGRAMLVLLGKRPERADQSPQTEQHWQLAATKVQADTWTDAVFPIKGNGGIDIHSLVVVPDCESPHNLLEDYACYIDEIVINDSATPRFRMLGDYGLNFDIDQPTQRTDRSLTNFTFSTTTHPGQQPTALNTKLLYNDLTAQTLLAKPGDVATTTFAYTGSWMNTYVYLDTDENGNFEYNVNADGTPAEGSNVMTYSHADGHNSVGQSLANAARNVLNPPTFTLPADLPHGRYRARFKVDWDCLDPAGNQSDGDTIAGNGGAVVDIILNVHGDYCQVNDANRNGEVLAAADGAKLNNYQAPFGQPLEIRMNPERGFEYAGVRVRHGYHLAGDSLVHGNAQYRDTVFDRTLFVNDRLTLPADIMDGDVEIEGLFVEIGTLPAITHVIYNVVDPDGNLITTREATVESGQPYPDNLLTTLCTPDYFTLAPLPDEPVSRHDTTLTLRYEPRFPFKMTTSLQEAEWYNLMIGDDHRPLYNNRQSKMRLYAKTLTTEESREGKYLWCVMGNPFDGLLIVSALTHHLPDMVLPDSVLTSSTQMLGAEGGSSYPVIRKYPFLATSKFSRGWFCQQSPYLNGFYLGQIENAANRMNVRDNYLAYWTAGAAEGSTFTLQYVGPESDLQTAIAAPTAATKEETVYDLQGRALPQAPQQKGIYIKGNRKVMR